MLGPVEAGWLKGGKTKCKGNGKARTKDESDRRGKMGGRRRGFTQELRHAPTPSCSLLVKVHSSEAEDS